MSQLKSKYKVFGGFGLLLGIVIYFLTLPWTTFPKQTAMLYSKEAWDYGVAQSSLLFYFVTLALFLWLLASQCKYLILTSYEIVFINPVLPFIRKKRNWSDYDYFQIIQERSRYGKKEAIWLIKDDKLKERISSYYYSNYSEIKAGLKIDFRGELRLGQWRQLACWFGRRISD